MTKTFSFHFRLLVENSVKDSEQIFVLVQDLTAV